MQITVANIEDMTIATELVSLNIGDTDVKIDIVGLLRAKDDSENAWINITPMMHMKEGNLKPVDWLRLIETKAYIRELYKGVLKPPFEITDEIAENTKVIPHYPKVYGRPVVDIKKGRYGGTWVHKDLFIEFSSWISVEFKVASHKLIKEVLLGTSKIKLERESTRELFHPLVKAIDEKYTPKQSYVDVERHRYQLMDMINKKVLGKRAKEFRRDNNLPTTGDVRDYLTAEALDKIKLLEQDMHGLIHYAQITDYATLKARLQKSLVEDAIQDKYKG